MSCAFNYPIINHNVSVCFHTRSFDDVFDFEWVCTVHTGYNRNIVFLTPSEKPESEGQIMQKAAVQAHFKKSVTSELPS